MVGPESITAPWRDHAPALANWAWEKLVVRTDCYGGQYTNGDGSIQRVTRKGLTFDHLVRHFGATADSPTEVVISLHNAADDETCRWVAVDVDKHRDESPEDNLRFAHRVRRRARKAGLTVLLVDSGGRGGYHVWVVFERPVPMADAHRLVLWLARGWSEFALPRQPDLFPRKDRLSGKRYGTPLRLIGRHHKRPSWPRIWSAKAKDWLEGEAAVLRLLSLRCRPADVASIVPADFDRPVRRTPPASTTSLVPCDEDRDLALVRDAELPHELWALGLA